MAKARNPNLPQINAGQMLYGAIDIELFPNGTAVGQIPYWDGTQWNFVQLVAGPGTSVNYDAVNNVLSFSHESAGWGTFTAGAVLAGTTTAYITADAELV